MATLDYNSKVEERDQVGDTRLSGDGKNIPLSSHIKRGELF